MLLAFSGTYRISFLFLLTIRYNVRFHGCRLIVHEFLWMILYFFPLLIYYMSLWVYAFSLRQSWLALGLLVLVFHWNLILFKTVSLWTCLMRPWVIIILRSLLVSCYHHAHISKCFIFHYQSQLIQFLQIKFHHYYTTPNLSF